MKASRAITIANHVVYTLNVVHVHPRAVTLPSLIIGLRIRGCLRVSGADLSSSTKFAIGQSVPLYAV
ncbi:hypothetical protein [Providencia alcalifaciens]|uniref:hypothetical protein n=1 Tax=Providencia alcalifaciens TaxID=126385 RepID=UPI00130EF88D